MWALLSRTLWTLQSCVTVSCRGLHTGSNRRGTVEQNFYTGIGLFSSSQQRATGQLVSVVQSFFFSQLLCALERELIRTGSLWAHREWERQRESKKIIKTTPASGHCKICDGTAHEHMQLTSSFLNWADCFWVTIGWTERAECHDGTKGFGEEWKDGKSCCC